MLGDAKRWEQMQELGGQVGQHKRCSESRADVPVVEDRSVNSTCTRRSSGDGHRERHYREGELSFPTCPIIFKILFRLKRSFIKSKNLTERLVLLPTPWPRTLARSLERAHTTQRIAKVCFPLMVVRQLLAVPITVVAGQHTLSAGASSMPEGIPGVISVTNI